MPIALFRPAAILLPLVAALSSGQSLKVGEPAPPLALERTIPSGMNAEWDVLRGKPVVIEFWATWCANCVAEIPRLNELVSKFPEIQFISISDEQPSAVEPFLAQRPILGWVGLDHAGSTFKTYGIDARPQTMLVDSHGVLRGVLHPAQVTAPVLSDLAAGRPVSPQGLRGRLRVLDQAADPVYAVVLRPSTGNQPGGRFGLDPGTMQGDNLPLKTIIAYAYSVSQTRLEGPDYLLRMHYDFCVQLPAGITGDVEILRDMLQRALKLKIRREPREENALVLKLAGAKPQEFSAGLPMPVLVGILEGRMKHPVVDETSLGGRYRFDFPDNHEDLLNSLRQQLHLELSPEKRPIDTLIVESLELPSYRVGIPGR
ncbi:exported hypothetical protein [Candidatus Sulfopaludibacter sp. SbA6]|nr:exported hypothetical protein [Candidatus Sulfopaludibacter sp. SbA6]